MISLSAPPTVPLHPATQAPSRSDWLRALAEHRWACRVFLLTWCGILFFCGLGSGELWRTESLRAIIAQEFLNSGNWIVPTLYGEPLFTKPPGFYAAIALCSWPFGGVTEWTARLPSALAATATVMLFSWFFGRQLGRPAGLLAGLILPMSLLWLDKASAAEIDTLQVFWVTASLLFFFRALEAYPAPESPNLVTAWTSEGRTRLAPLQSSTNGSVPQRSAAAPDRERWLWWSLALLCVAGGTLTKWTGPAFFYLTVMPLLWRRQQLALLFQRHHIVCASLAAGLCLAWAVWAVALAGRDVFFATVYREASQRLIASASPKPYPWGAVLLHPWVVLLSGAPVSLAAVLTLRPSFALLWDDRGRRLLQALHCWLWPNLLLWSVMTEHTPRHSFPMLPALAGLSVMVWAAWVNGRLAWPLRRFPPRRALVAFLILWLGCKGVFVHAVTPHRNANREPRAKGQLLAQLVPGDAVLYLFRLKDEGIMFYFGRPVRRLPCPADLPRSGTDLYCILQAEEWRRWDQTRAAELIEQLYDEQGDIIVLIRVKS